MKKNVILLCLTFFVLSTINAKEKKSAENFYQFKAKSLEGKEISMKDYKGKVVLVVNTASKCGFTPQYEGLEVLYKKYKDKGLVILGFPCNQFGGQEPGDEKEISTFCTLKYGVTFPMFSKIDVNGNNSHPIYKYLKVQLPDKSGNEIRWNFTKFLLDRNGKPIQRYESKTKPIDIIEDIEKLLAE